MDEMWRKTYPGKRTREAFERGDSVVHDDSTIDNEAELRAYVEKRRAENRQKEQVVELPKDPEIIEYAGMTQLFLANERARLGLPPGLFLELERIKLYHPDAWSQVQAKDARETDARGYYLNTHDLASAVNKDAESGKSTYEHFHTVSHELIHQASFTESDPAGAGLLSRHGLVSVLDTGHVLSEAITEDLNIEFLRENRLTFKERFPAAFPSGSRVAHFTELRSYPLYRQIVAVIIAQVDNALYEGASVTRDNLKRAMLGGDGQARKDLLTVLGFEDYMMLMHMGNITLYDVEKARTLYQVQYDIQGMQKIIDEEIARYFLGDYNGPLTEEKKRESFDSINSIVNYKPTANTPI